MKYADLKIILIGSSYPKIFQNEKGILPEYMWNIKKLENNKAHLKKLILMSFIFIYNVFL